MDGGGGEDGGGMAGENGQGEDGVRFEDLTVDDDLPIIDRISRYINSQVALQRLVHVKMLAEAAELSGYVRIVSTRFIFCVFSFCCLACSRESLLRTRDCF